MVRKQCSKYNANWKKHVRNVGSFENYATLISKKYLKSTFNNANLLCLGTSLFIAVVMYIIYRWVLI